jgi:hypothetical protein
LQTVGGYRRSAQTQNSENYQVNLFCKAFQDAKLFPCFTTSNSQKRKTAKKKEIKKNLSLKKN